MEEHEKTSPVTAFSISLKGWVPWILGMVGKVCYHRDRLKIAHFAYFATGINFSPDAKKRPSRAITASKGGFVRKLPKV